MRLHQHLEYRARASPDLEWARVGTKGLSYGEAAERVARLAGAFVRAGLEPGERVAILSKNCLEYPLLYLAASKAGVVPVPVNFRLAPSEWRYILENAGASVLIAQPAFAEAVDGIRSELPRLRHRVSIGDAGRGWTPLVRWLETEPLSIAAARERAWDEVSQIYTSGTTGRPKGVVMSQRAVLAVITQYRMAYDLRLGERMLLVVPMYHMGGVLWSGFAASCGASLCVMTDFDPHETVRVLDGERVSFTFLVPSMIQACLTRVEDVGTRRYADLRMIGYGASPIAEATLRRALRGLPVRLRAGLRHDRERRNPHLPDAARPRACAGGAGPSCCSRRAPGRRAPRSGSSTSRTAMPRGRGRRDLCAQARN